jgi:hypothetical protein
MQIDYPFRQDVRGRTATASDEQHIRDMIEQVLFTTPGERVNRPSFGSGVMQLVFAPNSETFGSAFQLTIQAALQQWLGDSIEVEDVTVVTEDSKLNVAIRYITRRDGQRRTTQFERSI